MYRVTPLISHACKQKAFGLNFFPTFNVFPVLLGDHEIVYVNPYAISMQIKRRESFAKGAQTWACLNSLDDTRLACLRGSADDNNGMEEEQDSFF